MSLKLKVNFKRGWPNPSAVTAVAAPNAGVTTLEAGKVGYLNSTGKWVLGITAVNQTPYVFRNDQDSPDAARGAASNADTLYVQLPHGGVQGVALTNPIEFQTTQYVGTPAFGNELSVNVDGKFKVAVATEVIVAIVTKAPHAYQDSTYIQVIPDNSKRIKV